MANGRVRAYVSLGVAQPTRVAAAAVRRVRAALLCVHIIRMGRKRNRLMSSIARILAVGLLFALAAPARAAAPLDAVALFREEIVDVNAQLKWRGGKLPDETLLAAAATGVSWRPDVSGAPLFREERKVLRYTTPELRLRGFSAARRGGDDKAAFAYALSLVLDPAPSGLGWLDAYDYLCQYDDSFDKVLIGVLQAPDKLPLLASYQYAVADVLVHRGSVRLLAMLLTLADSGDVYLRSRAVAALGVAANRQRGAGAGGGLHVILRQQTLSAGQRRMVDAVLQRAAGDGSVRVRAAAALALGLAGDEDAIPLLERLMKDPACLRTPAGGKDRMTLAFPVRAEAAAALARLGREQAPVGGTFQGSELKKALRGTADVSKELAPRRGVKTSGVTFHDGVW